MRYVWLMLALGFTGTALGQHAPAPAPIRKAMETPPRYWTTANGETISVRLLTLDRSKVQLLLGEGSMPRIATVQIPYLDEQHRDWIAHEVHRRTAETKKPAARYRSR